MTVINISILILQLYCKRKYIFLPNNMQIFILFYGIL